MTQPKTIRIPLPPLPRTVDMTRCLLCRGFIDSHELSCSQRVETLQDSLTKGYGFINEYNRGYTQGAKDLAGEYERGYVQGKFDAENRG